MTEKTNAFGVPTYQYQIRLPGFDFEGPLDLLLQLIERNELPITEIALARIADEYVTYINQLSEVNPAELAEFLVIAAKLLLIKSIVLLPAPPARANAAEEAPNAAEELLAQIREYKRVKEAAVSLRERQEQGFHAYTSRRVGPNDTILQQVSAALLEQDAPSPSIGPGSLKLKDLLALVQRRLTQQQQQQLKLPLAASEQDLKVLVRSIKIEDKIQLLETRMEADSNRPVEFTSLFDPASPPGPVEVIVTFMAVLELLRRRLVTVRQDELFGEIYVERVAPQTNPEN
jgi:segregation and condensation protein A